MWTITGTMMTTSSMAARRNLLANLVRGLYTLSRHFFLWERCIVTVIISALFNKKLTYRFAIFLRATAVSSASRIVVELFTCGKPRISYETISQFQNSVVAHLESVAHGDEGADVGGGTPEGEEMQEEEEEEVDMGGSEDEDVRTISYLGMMRSNADWVSY